MSLNQHPPQNDESSQAHLQVSHGTEAVTRSPRLLGSAKLWSSGLVALLTFTPLPVQAQANPIQAAPDGTGTIVNVNGNQFNITGGTLSGDKANLFHSFSQFGLNQNQIATFLSNPNIQNILSRVNGNNPSIINGLLQVSGSNANLYLINPSGIVFGPNASLNVPAAFIASTGNGVQFGNNGWFSATGNNNYASLNGNPTALAFTMGQPGGIINAGNLSVGPGQQIALVGGTVINTGTISTPGGQVTVMAVPGQSAVRLSSPGSVLSLELPLQPSASQPNQLQVPPLSLAELLTGGQATGVNTGVAVTPGGQVQVAGTTLTAPTGTALVTGQISTLNPQGTGGTVQILGQNVGLLSANLNASGQNGGGTVLIGGDYLGQGSTPTALRTYIDANSRIAADALGRGNGGRVIAWANDSTRFGGFISVQGGPLGGNGGFVETSGKNSLVVMPTAQVNASAVNGLAGQWLLDPSNVSIRFDSSGTLTNGVFDPPVSSSIDPDTIATALNGGTNVTITTSSGARGAGDITLVDSINQNGGGTASLTLTSRRFFLSRDLESGFSPSINLTSTGGLTFNLNQVASETIAPIGSIQNAHDAIGIVAGSRTINLYAPTGGTVTFGSVPDLPGSIGTGIPGATLSLNRNVTINGVGGPGNVILSGENTRQVVNIAAGGTLSNAQPTITSTNVTLNGLTISGGNTSGDGGGVGTGIGTTVTINNSIIQNNVAGVSGGGVGVGFGSTVNINDSTLTTNRALFAGAVENLGTLNISGSTISNNIATSGFGGGIDNHANAVILNSTITNNTTPGFGGGIYNGTLSSTPANLTLTNTQVANNSAAGGGGGLYNLDTAIVNNSTFAGNFVTNGDGGGILNSGTLTITGGTLSSNNASGDGGGLTNVAPGSTSLTGINILSNTASNGGGIALTGGTLAITNSSISNNISNGTALTTQGGGGIVTAPGTTLTIVGSNITNNSSSGGGGGIGSAGTLNISNSAITNNTAAQVGGGIAANGDTTITNGTNISGNTSSAGGGGIFNLGSLAINGSTVSGNSAPVGGGILNTSTLTSPSPSPSPSSSGSQTGPGTLNINGSTISNNSATQGNGGGILNLGTLAMTGATLSSNTASSQGGGLANMTSTTSGVFSFSGAGFATLTDTGVSSNTASSGGGGILNDSSLTLSNSPILANTTPGGVGGGIRNNNSLAIFNSIISNNSAGFGAGLWNSGRATIATSRLEGNSASDHGGAIDTLETASTQITGSSITNNTAGFQGGGLYVHGSGILTIANSSIIGNTAPSGDVIFSNSGSTVNLNGLIPVTGSLVLNGLLNLQTDTTLTGVTTASFANITGSGLNLTASGNINLTGNVDLSGDGESPVGNLSITTPAAIAANPGGFIFANNLNLQTGTGLTAGLVAAQGNLNLSSTTDNITTGGLGALGNLTVDAPQGNIVVNTITLPGGLGDFGGVYSQAGTVQLLAPNGTLRVTGTIPSLLVLAPNGTPVNTGPAAGASVYSGATDTIFINLFNSPSLPFVVGNPAINGTFGRLQTPTESVLSGNFNFLFRSPGQTIGIFLPDRPNNPPTIDPTCSLNPVGCAPPRTDPERPDGGGTNPLNPGLGQPITPLARLERNNCLEFQRYFGSEFSRLVGERNPCDQEVTVAGIQEQLRQIERETGQKSAIIYIAETPAAVGISAFFAEGQPVTRIVNNVGQLQLEALANDLRDEVAPLTAGGSLDASVLGTDSYLQPAQRLHQALIAPIAADLEARGIQVLVFSMGRGLRGIPMAALHDGKQFLIEKYAVGMIPSLNLTQVSYAKNLRGSQMLAMGASQWESRGVRGVPDLPSVPTELNLVAQTSGLPTQTYLNPTFTTANLVQQRSQPVRVVHLATHGEFLAGQPNQSFIRFWDSNVNLAQMRQLQLNAPEVDLLTLSACQTAAGDEQAELGFAGMALAAGVKTTVASLWYVSDVSTMAMMSSFYNNLQTASTKAQALRQTQIAMLRGQVRLEGNQLLLGNQSLTLPPDQVQTMNRQLTQLRVRDFRHPYFWSAFTMVGSPW